MHDLAKEFINSYLYFVGYFSCCLIGFLHHLLDGVIPIEGINREGGV